MRGHAALATSSTTGTGGGRVVAGKFRVERMLGEGGMGIVWKAIDLHLERPVALKFLRADVSSNWEAGARFMREAKAAAQLESEHVARVLDVSVTDDGTPYIVMEYLEGQSLASALASEGPFSPRRAAETIIQACEGLAEAHSRGIVHRDVKPANLFLVQGSPWRTVKILDFGISKRPRIDGQEVTTGVVMGSPCYMSPEQLSGTANVDHRTDLWSLGATLYEVLTGRTLFDASVTLPQLVSAILHLPHQPLRQHRPDVPRELAAVVDRCLAKRRELRFGSAAEMASALARFAPSSAKTLIEHAASMAPAFPSLDAPAPERLASPERETAFPRDGREGPVSELRHMGHVAVGERRVPSYRVAQVETPAKTAITVSTPVRLALVGCAIGGLTILGAVAMRARGILPSTDERLARASAATIASPDQATSIKPMAELAPPGELAPAPEPEPPLDFAPLADSNTSSSVVTEPIALVPPPRAATPPARMPSPHSAPSQAHETPAKEAEPAESEDEAEPTEAVSAEPASPAPPVVRRGEAVDDRAQVDPAGGRVPRRPIETKNPYE